MTAPAIGCSSSSAIVAARVFALPAYIIRNTKGVLVGEAVGASAGDAVVELVCLGDQECGDPGDVGGGRSAVGGVQRRDRHRALIHECRLKSAGRPVAVWAQPSAPATARWREALGNDGPRPDREGT